MHPSKVLQTPEICVHNEEDDDDMHGVSEPDTSSQVNNTNNPRHDSPTDLVGNDQTNEVDRDLYSANGDDQSDPADEIDDPAPEMRDPSKIDISDVHNNNNSQRRDAQEKMKNAEEKLDRDNSGVCVSLLHWLSGISLLEEVRKLNSIYRTCLSYGDPLSFSKLMSTRSKEDYEKEKTKLGNKLDKRRTTYAWKALKILLPICFFTRLFQTNNGLPETVVVEETPDQDQTVREMKRVEGTMKFEYQNSLLEIRPCSICHENHLVETKKKLLPTDIYKCGKCKKLKDENAYLKNRLLPIWYERVAGATSHTEFKLDSDGNKIIHYEIPEELLCLTVAEQLLIRRCAPFIPSFHIGKGYYGLKGHCVAFAQDITDMAMTLPQRPESVVTFIRAIGNKDTTDLKLKHLKVSKVRVVRALQWLKIHHEGYHDVSIDMTRFAWMKGNETAIIKGNEKKLVFEDQNKPISKDFVSKVQCAGDIMKDGELDYSIFGMSTGDTVPNTESDNINELVDTSETAHGKEKLMMFPPHSEKPIW